MLQRPPGSTGRFSPGVEGAGKLAATLAAIPRDLNGAGSQLCRGDQEHCGTERITQAHGRHQGKNSSRPLQSHQSFYEEEQTVYQHL